MTTETSTTSPTTNRFLRAAAFVTIAGVAVVAFATEWSTPPGIRLAIIAGLLALFTVIQIPLVSGTPTRIPRVRGLLASAIATALALLWVWTDNAAPILLFLPITQVFLYLELREALAWTIVCTLLLLVPYLVFTTVTTAIVMALVFGGGFIFFGAVTTSFRLEQAARAKSERLLQELETAHAQLRDYAARVQELSVAEERSRIAREIHDSLGHHLTLLSVQLQAASKLIAREPDRAASEIEKARAVAAEALQAVRQSVSTLRATSFQELRVSESLARLTQEFCTTTGIAVNLVIESASVLDALPPAQALTLYRAAQEGLTNAHKHARATQVDITVKFAHARISLRVADNGVGRDLSALTTGFGLLGLRERVELLDGALTAQNRAEGGFELLVDLPVSQVVE
ncbi:MAG: sensor histidine kinase [Chloroflexi bacterium]|nr:sensor histidine kinase [Chloroflexota bacterium]